MKRRRQDRCEAAAPAHNLGPHGLLLRGIQDQETGGGDSDLVLPCVLLPCVVNEALPVEDVWSGPRLQSLVLPGAVEGEREGPAGALAGRNHAAAPAQACVDF